MSTKAWLIVWLIAALLLPMAVQAETAAQPEWVETLSADDVRLYADSMFTAAIGTTEEAEQAARKDIGEAEQEERNARNAEYRAQTLPWLMQALLPKDAQSVICETEAEESGTDGFPLWTWADSYDVMQENELGLKYLMALWNLGGTDAESCMEIARTIARLWMAQVDHEGLAEINGDYTLWIYGPGTQIDYPVVLGSDNSYYLNRLFSGERNASGTLFIDYRNLTDFQDPNTLIYGHNMRNGSMFGELTNYEQQAYYESHPYLLVMSEDEIALVEVFAGYTTKSSDHCYDIAISDDEDMLEFIGEAKEKSDFVSETTPEAGDRLVTLSTCAYRFKNARYIAIGRLVSIWVRTEQITENTKNVP